MKPNLKPPPNTRRQKIGLYVRALMSMIGLRDWKLDVREELPANGGQASVELLHGRKYAVLRLSEDFLNDTPEGQRQTICHELIHIHQAPWIRVLEVKEYDDPAVKLAMEYATDGLADGFAQFLPLPPKVKSI